MEAARRVSGIEKAAYAVANRLSCGDEVASISDALTCTSRVASPRKPRGKSTCPRGEAVKTAVMLHVFHNQFEKVERKRMRRSTAYICIK